VLPVRISAISRTCLKRWHFVLVVFCTWTTASSRATSCRNVAHLRLSLKKLSYPCMPFGCCLPLIHPLCRGSRGMPASLRGCCRRAPPDLAARSFRLLLAAFDNTVVASVFRGVNSSKQSTAGIWTYPARLLGKAKPFLFLEGCGMKKWVAFIRLSKTYA
jgi:hypothetical protein